MQFFALNHLEPLDSLISTASRKRPSLDEEMPIIQAVLVLSHGSAVADVVACRGLLCPTGFLLELPTISRYSAVLQIMVQDGTVSHSKPHTFKVTRVTIPLTIPNQSGD